MGLVIRCSGSVTRRFVDGFLTLLDGKNYFLSLYKGFLLESSVNVVFPRGLCHCLGIHSGLRGREVFSVLLVLVWTVFWSLYQHLSFVRFVEVFVQEFPLRFKDFPDCTALVAGGTL